MNRKHEMPSCTVTLQKKSDASMQEALNETLPESYSRYLNAYEMFIKWQESNHVNSFAESVLLDYFRELSTKYKPSSLWCTYSMLKSTILCNHKVSISEYDRLFDFLKSKADGFQSKKFKVFTTEDVNKFLVEAPDDKYLLMKTVLVFGVIAKCGLKSVTNVKIDNVKDNGDEIIVRIPDVKTKVAKAIVIEGQFAEIVRKYIKLRPIPMSTDRFFIHYGNSECSDRVLGIHKISKFPKEIAKFLKLPESEAYSVYSYCNTATKMLGGTGVGIETRHRELKSSKLTEGNVQESLQPKITRIDCSKPCSIKQEEIINDPLSLIETVPCTGMSDNSSSSESEEHSDSTDDTGLNNSHHRTKAPKRKREKRPKRQKGNTWYDEECLTQIKLTNNMFKRLSMMNDDKKAKMLSDFSMHRIEIFKKYINE